jgi:nicotinate-nucleotide--dimethylbenzimidazole phosphoribosyltransferase
MTHSGSHADDITYCEREVIDACARIPAIDDAAREQALARQRRLTKPPGALGRLEDLHAWMAGVRGTAVPPTPNPVIIVAAADHGVATEGVSAYPSAVTAQMFRNFVSGGAAINVLAAHAGARVVVVDAGVATDLDESMPEGAITTVKLRKGTSNFAATPAMTRSECTQLIARGIGLARDLAADGVDVFGLGDMGIGNTTAAAALTCAFTGHRPALTVGRGTGIDDARYAAKRAVVERALALHAPSPADPVGTLAAVGGFELAFLAGVVIGAAATRCAVVLDGYPTTAAALAAAALAPSSVDFMLASHRSAEPGHDLALAHLGLRPLLDLDLRLGEGTGAALACSLLTAALRIPHEMATFDSAGVSRAEDALVPET